MLPYVIEEVLDTGEMDVRFPTKRNQVVRIPIPVNSSGELLDSLAIDKWVNDYGGKHLEDRGNMAQAIVSLRSAIGQMRNTRP